MSRRKKGEEGWIDIHCTFCGRFLVAARPGVSAFCKYCSKWTNGNGKPAYKRRTKQQKSIDTSTFNW